MFICPAFDVDVKTFYFGPETPFLGKFSLKRQKCLIRMELGA